ncbi:hypothetical protein F2P45_32940 [Massilia sp. CCM 8733]|uniref:Secreted protein n=1 Tax=Massilia mucilaginosa TaxID=2609282 RepID=A0ABX0P363_9BURK|nr:hypothetical protein [Massilia mucilaginosa]NHZ93771.1 hypothetical protein [Massilia mucilaginosa]
MQFLRQLRALVIVLGLMACLPAFAQTLDVKNIKPSGLTLSQSKQVLRVVMKHERYKMSSPKLSIDGPWLTDGKPVVPGYFHFGVVYVTSTQGHYAVNTSTGDVWDTESCERYTFPALIAIQKQISIKTGKKLASDDDARSELGCP